jgi:signal transduction histidine kinase
MILARVVAEPDDGRERDEHARMLGRLLPGALHELANPLLALGGTVEFLLDEAQPGTKQHDRLVLVQGTAGEIADLVRSLQSLVRERHETDRTIPLTAFVEETAALARRYGAARDVELLVRSSGRGSLTARPAALRAALLVPLVDSLRAAQPGATVLLEVDGAAVRLDGRALALP